MVPESVIDQVVDKYGESESALEEALAALEERQPMLYAYLLSEEFEAFTEEERDYLLFLAIAVWQSVETHLGPRPEVTEEQLNEAEESNWDALGEIQQARFRERVSLFFEGYAEEDLLAFIEDALVEDDDTPVTKEGREALFVSLKSVIDVLTA
jgi:hypothetical protein